MAKAILLSSEKAVINLMESVNNSVDMELSYTVCINQDMIDESFSEFEKVGAELYMVCGLDLPKKNNIHYIHIGYSTMDFIQLKYKLSSDKKIAVIALENMLEFIDDIDVVLYRVKNNKDIAKVVKNAVENGTNIIVGINTVCECAKELGVEYVHFTPGIEAVKYAVDAAQREKRLISAEKLNIAEKSALSYVNFGGIIKVDADGKILAINETGKYLLGCRDKYVIGSYVLNVFNQLDKELLDSVIKNGENVIMHFTGARNKRFLINIEPVFDDDKLVTAYIAFRKANQMTDKVNGENKSKQVTGRFSQYVYVSETFDTLLKKAKFASYTDAPILLYGEDGTETIGFANSIHNESSRYKMNFVEIECNAWDSDKMREILFGERNRKKGDEYTRCAVEIAECGTLFLNHIDKLSQEMQYLVVQIIKGRYSMETGMFNKNYNIRIIAATDKNLRKMVADGEFRRDLYYALSVISIEFPPLRERKEDIRCIVELFIAYYGEKYSKPVSIAEAGYDCMMKFNWPGNTRQLEYFCQKLLLTAPSRKISEAYVRSMLFEIGKDMDNENKDEKEQITMSEEARNIVDALCRNKGNRTKTAEELGISKATLWRRMQKYGITAEYLI